MSPIASFTSKPRAVVRSSASFVCHRSTFRCGNCRSNVLLGEMQKLLDRGVRQFKFVDRTFNLNLNISRRDSRVLPRTLPARSVPPLRDDPRPFARSAARHRSPISRRARCSSKSACRRSIAEVAKHISRRKTIAKLADNFRFLREETGVHVHADLIVGLPGED